MSALNEVTWNCLQSSRPPRHCFPGPSPPCPVRTAQGSTLELPDSPVKTHSDSMWSPELYLSTVAREQAPPSVSGPSPLLEPRVPPHLGGGRLGGRKKAALKDHPTFTPSVPTLPIPFPRGHMSLSEAKQVPLRIEAAFWSLTLCGHHSPLNLAPETEHKLFCILGRRLWVWLQI